MDLFRELGNDYTNSIWEAMLPKEDQGYVEVYVNVYFLNYVLPSCFRQFSS